MTNPICISPLKFYDDLSKQNHRKSYAHGHISPLITKANTISPFQLVVPNIISTITKILLVSVNTENSIDITQTLIDSGICLIDIDNYKILILKDNFPIPEFKYEGNYYLAITLSGPHTEMTYFSEVFCYTNQLDDCLLIEYWNTTGDFTIKNGFVTFQDGFKFQLYLKSELGKPDYNFEEEATKRLGYTFIESQVSKKIYHFNAILPEYICDAMRLIRLCSNKTLVSKGETYDMLTFDMDVDWQTQGDLASVTCEFETDNVIVNLGGFKFEEIGGDFRNSNYNDDFNNQ